MPIFMTGLFPEISELLSFWTLMETDGQMTKLRSSLVLATFMFYPTILLPESAFTDGLQNSYS